MASMYINGTMNGLLLTVVLFRACVSAITSKACYGAPGLPCTKHILECISGKISIQDAYYTNSTACPDVGVSSCNMINVSSIPDTGRYGDLSETQLNNLYTNCSAQQSCTFNGHRRNAFINFSIVKFICIKGNNTLKLICNKKLTTATDIVSTALPSSNSIKASSSTTDDISTVKSTTATETGYTSHLTSNVHYTTTILATLTTQGSGTDATDLPQTNTQESSNIGTIVGIVTPCLLIIIAMVLIAVYIVRRKKAKTVEKNAKTNPKTQGQEVYSLAGLVHQNEYFKIEKGPGKCATVDYGYAGIENISSNSSSKDHEVYSLAGGVHRNEYFEIEPSATQKSSTDYDYAGMPNTHARKNQIGDNFGTTNKQGKEDDYDHVGEKPITQNGHYDTTASVAKKLSKLEASDKNIDENVYSYDHLNGKPTRENANNDYDVAGRSSDYDTSASVQKRFDHVTECREDDYGYNHLGNQVQKKTLHNDFDTSASAATAVARLNSRTDEPDYDHVTKDTGGIPSSYDPGNIEDGSDVYALAKEANNPYQLAK